jgi:hypothetical protein
MIFAANSESFPNEYKSIDHRNGQLYVFCEVGMEFLTHYLEGLQISKFNFFLQYVFLKMWNHEDETVEVNLLFDNKIDPCFITPCMKLYLTA